MREFPQELWDSSYRVLPQQKPPQRPPSGLWFSLLAFCALGVLAFFAYRLYTEQRSLRHDINTLRDTQKKLQRHSTRLDQGQAALLIQGAAHLYRQKNLPEALEALQIAQQIFPSLTQEKNALALSWQRWHQRLRAEIHTLHTLTQASEALRTQKLDEARRLLTEAERQQIAGSLLNDDLWSIKEKLTQTAPTKAPASNQKKKTVTRESLAPPKKKDPFPSRSLTSSRLKKPPQATKTPHKRNRPSPRSSRSTAPRKTTPPRRLYAQHPAPLPPTARSTTKLPPLQAAPKPRPRSSRRKAAHRQPAPPSPHAPKDAPHHAYRTGDRTTARRLWLEQGAQQEITALQAFEKNYRIGWEAIQQQAFHLALPALHEALRLDQALALGESLHTPQIKKTLAHLHYTRSQHALQNKDYAQAAQHLQQALAIAPRQEDCQRALQHLHSLAQRWLLTAQKHRKENPLLAKSLLRRILKITTEDHPLHRQALTLLR